jgi:two-component system phosphate regulon response regulator PhoB
LRNVVFQYADSRDFARAMREGDQELPLPAGQTVGDGEWVLAIFEVGATPGTGAGTARRATAAAARGLHRGAGTAPVLAFERRDWERLVDFAEAGSKGMRAAAPVIPEEQPTQPSLPDVAEAVPSPKPSRPSFAHWRASDPFTQGPNARVLLVDDDRDIRDVVSAMLDAVGLTVESATSAEEALERVRASAFDLLVLDWNLPGMTGIELCRLVRRDPALATMPVLFLTAHASSRDVVEAFASGADDYVVKPFRAPELGARIFGLLRRARMGQAAT